MNIDLNNYMLKRENMEIVKWGPKGQFQISLDV